PECQVLVAAFELAVYPVTNAEFACFVDAKGYDDPTLWMPGGQVWLRGEGKLDPETEQQLRDLYRSFSRDVEAYIAWAKRTMAMDDSTADAYRFVATNVSEDEYVEGYTSQ